MFGSRLKCSRTRRLKAVEHNLSTMTPVIHLADFHVSSLHLTYVEPSSGTDGHIVGTKSGFDYDIAKKHDSNVSYRLKLIHNFQEFDAEDKPLGCKLKVTITGFFEFPEDSEDESRDALIRLNGVSILYGILRGVVATVSGLQPGGKITLPAIMPQEIVRMVEDGKKERAAAETQSKE